MYHFNPMAEMWGHAMLKKEEADSFLNKSVTERHVLPQGSSGPVYWLRQKSWGTRLLDTVDQFLVEHPLAPGGVVVDKIHERQAMKG